MSATLCYELKGVNSEKKSRLSDRILRFRFRLQVHEPEFYDMEKETRPKAGQPGES